MCGDGVRCVCVSVCMFVPVCVCGGGGYMQVDAVAHLLCVGWGEGTLKHIFDSAKIVNFFLFI